MRIKIRRVLMPFFILMLSVISGVWFYTAFTDLDFFTVRNHEATFSPCSEWDSIPITDYQADMVRYVADGADTSLIGVYKMGIQLKTAYESDSMCAHAQVFKRLVSESVECLRSLMYSRQSAITQSMSRHVLDSTGALGMVRLELIGLLMQEHNDRDTILNHVIHLEANRYHRFGQNKSDALPSPILIEDSLKQQLLLLAAEMSLENQRWNREKELAFIKLSEARIDHGLKMEEARTRIFMMSLTAWMVSLLAISLFYLKSVLRRMAVDPVPVIMLDETPDSPLLKPSSVTASPEVEPDSQDVTSVSDLDLSKVFFDCGGDIQLMKKKVNRHMTTTFAAMGNLKSYHRSGNSEGAIRVLKVLSESNAQMGFAAIQARVDAMVDQLHVDGQEQWNGLGDLLVELAGQIDILRDRLSSHPAFKN